MAAGACAEGTPARPDVFVIVVDTARRDAWQTYRPGLPVGDALDSLARDGVTFERLRTPTSWTRPSVATLLTGLSPLQHRVQRALDALPAEIETLPQLLHRRGYRTLGWSSNGHVLPQWGFAAGFDAFADLSSRDARAIFSTARRALEHDPSRPVFTYIHVLDPHLPYDPPPEHLRALHALDAAVVEGLGRPAPDDRGALDARLRYLAEVRYADAELGRFLAFLRSAGRYDDALVLVVGDHGEELRDHGRGSHGHTLYEEVLLVPAVLKLPGNPRAGERIPRDVELHDLLATLAPWLGIEIPPASPGVDALSARAPSGPQAYEVAEHRIAALRDGPWKLIASYATGHFELYDLRADPTEQHNLSRREPARVAELRVKLERLTTRHAPGWHLRGCGCREPAELAFALTGLEAAPTPLNLEEEDRLVPAPDGALHVELQLTPERLTAGGSAGKTPDALPDEDELSLADGAAREALELRPVASAGLLVARANAPPLATRTPLTLRADVAENRVHAGEPVLCGRPELFQCRPHLRVWYSEPALEVPAANVAPELLERLRALGYQL